MFRNAKLVTLFYTMILVNTLILPAFAASVCCILASRHRPRQDFRGHYSSIEFRLDKVVGSVFIELARGAEGRPFAMAQAI